METLAFVLQAQARCAGWSEKKAYHEGSLDEDIVMAAGAAACIAGAAGGRRSRSRCRQRRTAGARQLCVDCHVVAPGEAGTQVTAGIPSFMAVANKPGQTPEKIQDFILSPHPPMPQVQLTNFERANLAAYILSLKN